MDYDEYAGLPMLEVYPYRKVHPKSVPFGPLPVQYVMVEWELERKGKEEK